LLAFIVLSSASVPVLLFEATAPDANITTGGDGIWWAIVTITTVGYGGEYLVTAERPSDRARQDQLTR